MKTNIVSGWKSLPQGAICDTAEIIQSVTLQKPFNLQIHNLTVLSNPFVFVLLVNDCDNLSIHWWHNNLPIDVGFVVGHNK
jgi:hypothetical protein